MFVSLSSRTIPLRNNVIMTSAHNVLITSGSIRIAPTLNTNYFRFQRDRIGYLLFISEKKKCVLNALSCFTIIMAKLNLLQGDFNNPIFAVTFDFYSPRPHFMILTKEDASIEREFCRITPEQTQRLIEAGKSVLESFKIEGGMLSIQRGARRSEKGKIHVHFCVNVESYLRVFESRKKDIPGWPSPRYVRKEWKWSKDPLSYARNVRGYPYRTHLQQEVEAIKTNSSREPSVPVLGKVQLEGGISTIVYHPSHPKIGFVDTKPDSIQEFQQVLCAMEKLSQWPRLDRFKI